MSGAGDTEAELRSIKRRRIIMGFSIAAVLYVAASHGSRLMEARFHLDPDLAWWGSYALLSLPFIWLFGRLDRLLNPDANTTKMLIAQREDIQRKNLFFAWLQAVTLAATLVACLLLSLQPQPAQAGINFQRWLLPVFALTFVPEIFGTQYNRSLRATMNNELTRFIRARALALGYATVVVAVTFVYVGSFYWKNMVTVGLPVVLFLSIVVPRVSFAVLERRADSTN